MARPLRLEHPGAIWHVTSRGNERRPIYRSDRDRSTFLDLLGDTVQHHHWTLHAYVLMTNHYHLVFETPQPTLSAGMKRLNEQHAQIFNSRHRRVGHLFQGRFKGILVERESHLLELLRYVVLNPVRCKAVEYAGDYRWSSYRATAGLERAPEWLETSWTLDQFRANNGTLADAREAYRRFVADGRGAKYKPWESLIGDLYLGGEQFCERMQAIVSAEPRSREHPKRQREFVRPTFEAVVESVALHFGETVSSLQRRSHSSCRKAVAQLGWEESNLTFAALGQWLGVTGAAAAHLARAGRELESRDDGYAERVQKARCELRALGG